MGQSTISHSTQGSDNWGQQARRLLKPEEVAALSPRIAITFTPGVPPVWTTLIRYYEEKLPTAVGMIWERLVIFARSVVFLLVALGLAWMVEETVSKHHAMPGQRLHRTYDRHAALQSDD